MEQALQHRKVQGNFILDVWFIRFTSLKGRKGERLAVTEGFEE